MKLLIYSDVFFPSVGGVERVSFNLAHGLASLATFDVTVVTRTDRGNADESELPFVIVREPSLGLLWRLIGLADLVHLAGPAMLPLGLALVRRKAVVIEHHGFQTICPNGQMFHVPEK
ncbi:MAG TPA: glycosyltransferase, partial [Terriglobales bacterium]|nr:glycosyltransferase [Terriglobales bacterium]